MGTNALISVPMSALRAYCVELIGNDSLCDGTPSEALSACFDYAETAADEGDAGPTFHLAGILAAAIVTG